MVCRPLRYRPRRRCPLPQRPRRCPHRPRARCRPREASPRLPEPPRLRQQPRCAVASAAAAVRLGIPNLNFQSRRKCLLRAHRAPLQCPCLLVLRLQPSLLPRTRWQRRPRARQHPPSPVRARLPSPVRARPPSPVRARPLLAILCARRLPPNAAPRLPARTRWTPSWNQCLGRLKALAGDRLLPRLEAAALLKTCARAGASK